MPRRGIDPAEVRALIGTRTSGHRLKALGAVIAAMALLATTATVASAASPLKHAPDPTWQTNGKVRAVAFSPDGTTVYIAGEFSAVRPPGAALGNKEVTRRNAAAFDVSSGKLLRWNPHPDGEVWTLAVGPSGSRVFLGGEFTHVRGRQRVHVAAVTAASGKPTKFKASTGGRVETLLPTRKRLYVGGQFGEVNGVRHGRIAALRAATGKLVTSFKTQVTQYTNASCPPRCVPVVASLALSKGTLFIGGHFGLINGVNRNNVGAVDAGTGSHLRKWNPNVFHNNTSNPNQKNTVYQILPHGTHVYICGDFNYVGGTVHPNIASTFRGNGGIDKAFKGSDDGGTQACVIRGGVLYLGGHFQLIDGTARSHIGAVDLQTGALDPWSPGANSARGIHAFDVHGPAGSFRLVVGGEFTRIGGVSQQGFAKFSP